MSRVVLATRNAKKLGELARILGGDVQVLGLADVFVWVTDPQKYADAVLHDQYLRRAARHQTVTLVVLNQADRLNGEELDRALKDLRRLLDSEGLSATPVMAMSALHGTGVRELRQLLEQQPFDVLAIDESLMSSSGVDFCMAIRGRYPGMTRIVMTNAPTREIVDARSHGVIDGYVVKPVSASTLLAQIRSSRKE